MVRDQSAIALDESKLYLVESRLKPLTRELHLDSIGDLVRLLRTQKRGPMVDRVIDAMTTNETSWLRDSHPFSVLIDKILPELAERRGTNPIQIWSAACSSGQEPYGIAMLIADHLPHLRPRIKIHATDISKQMLDKAKHGSYTQLEMNRGMPAPMMIRHFDRVGMHWQIKPEIQSMVQFRQHNLDDPFTGIPRSDIVLIRNVLIYFDAEVKQQIFTKIERVIRPDGYLLLGAAETTAGIDGPWRSELVSKTRIYSPS